MDGRRSIEELRDLLPALEQDAVYLGQYGHLSCSLDIFHTLKPCDQRRLVALALAVGNVDIQSVAYQLMCKLVPEPGTLQELYGQISPDDVREIQSLGENVKSHPKPTFTMADYTRILEELQYACEEMSSKPLEEAHWILIAQELEEDADWIDAMGGQDNSFSAIGSSVEVGYTLSYQEKLALLTEMRQARWVLHIHNHPPHPFGASMAEYFPSEKDLDFSNGWKSIRPEIGERMLFFIIHAGRVIEYGLPHNQLRQWI